MYAEIEYYKTNVGIFAKTGSQKHQINGVDGIETFSREWRLYKTEEPLTLTRWGSHPKENVRWELKDKDLASRIIPKTLTTEQTGTNGQYCDEWDSFDDLKGLYEYKFDQEPDCFMPAKGELVKRLDLDVSDFESPCDMKFTVLREPSWNHQGKIEKSLKSVVLYGDFIKICTPEFLLHTKPCLLSSFQSYEIIREHVKENIDNNLAVVSSDYKFCFAVDKRIPIKPYTRKTEKTKANGKSFAKPKFNHKNITHHKTDVIFSATPANEKYRGYPVLEPFRGESLLDLKENIELFLGDLMATINDPITECPSCSGHGYVREEGK